MYTDMGQLSHNSAFTECKDMRSQSQHVAEATWSLDTTNGLYNSNWDENVENFLGRVFKKAQGGKDGRMDITPLNPLPDRVP